MKKISIVVPMYNEEKTIQTVLARISEVNFGLKKEIIIVDDGSKDNSKKLAEEYANKTKIKGTTFKLITKENGGKGSALRKGYELAKGDIVAVQDADLEYNPSDIKKLAKLIIDGKEKVVYGSRFLTKHKPKYRIFFLGNKFLTLLTKILYHSRITDMETCYKVFDRKVLEELDLKSDRFDIEPETTAKILKMGIRIKEVPITYTPRTIEEGKKINWKDGIQAVYTLIKLKFF